MARPWRKRPGWPYVGKSGRRSYRVGFYDHDKRERTKSFPSAGHARAWMHDYVTAERRGRDSLRRFLLDLDAKEANEAEGRTIAEIVELFLETDAHPRNEEGVAPATYELYASVLSTHMLGKPRTERASASLTDALYVDSDNVLGRLSSEEHQVIFGRRGTGKTATLTSFGQRAVDRGDLAVLIDLRTIGSGGIYADPRMLIQERRTRLLADVMRHLVEALIDTGVQDEGRSWIKAFEVMERLVAMTAKVQVLGPVERPDGEATRAHVPDPAFHRLEATDPVDWSLWTGELGHEMVIGRRAALDTNAREKLQSWVANSATIEVLTFDDLAVNARSLYKNLNGGS